jgi:hypothetical protein
MFTEAMNDGDAANAATGWGGDRYTQYENGDKTAIAWRIVGDSAADAAHIKAGLDAYVGPWTGKGLGSASVTLRGSTVNVVFSNDADALAKAASALNG